MKVKATDSVQRFPGLFFQKRTSKFLVIEPANFKWAVVDEGLKEYIDFIEIERSVQTAQEYGLNLANVEELYTAGLVQINGESKYKTDFHGQNTNKELSLVILHTSNSCNFNCTYCYADASSGKPMDFSVAKCALDQAAQLHEGPVLIEFHGGEPLLNFGLIKDVVTYGNKFHRKDGSRKFKFSTQTNLSLMDDEIADYFIENEVGIGFSIDGPQQFNDKTRIYRNGESTYKGVMRGLKLLQAKGVPLTALVVVSDIAVIDQIYDFMVDTGIRSLKLSYYFRQGRAKDIMPVQKLQKEYACKLLKLTDRVFEHNARNKVRLEIKNISYMLHPILGAEIPFMCMKCPCGAGISQIGIDVDGSVYPCEEMNGKGELSIGNITQDPLVDMLASPVAKRLKERTVDQMQDCRTCEIRNACKINCPNESYNETGDFDQKTEMCDFFKVIYPELMWRVYEHRDSIKTLI